MKQSSLGLIASAAVAMALSATLSFAQGPIESTYMGRRIIIPKSSIPHPGRMHTNYFIVPSRVH